MRRDNAIFLSVNFTCMGAGILLPQIGKPLAFLPTVCMVIQLLLSFISSTSPAIPLSRSHMKGISRFILLKMFVAPICCGVFFSFVFPEFSLAAMMVAGSAVGVTAPVIALIVRADSFFVIGSVIVTSFIMPFSVPLLAWTLLLLNGRSMPGMEEAFLHSGVFLAICMAIPFSVAKLLWGKAPNIAESVLEKRFFLSMVCMGATTVVLFSRYAEAFWNNPWIVLELLAMVFILAALLVMVGFVGAWRYEPEKQLSMQVGTGCINNVLIAITAAQFFSYREVLFAALYSVPYVLLVVPFDCSRHVKPFLLGSNSQSTLKK